MARVIGPHCAGDPSEAHGDRPGSMCMVRCFTHHRPPVGRTVGHQRAELLAVPGQIPLSLDTPYRRLDTRSGAGKRALIADADEAGGDRTSPWRSRSASLEEEGAVLSAGDLDRP